MNLKCKSCSNSLDLKRRHQGITAPSQPFLLLSLTQHSFSRFVSSIFIAVPLSSKQEQSATRETRPPSSAALIQCASTPTNDTGVSIDATSSPSIVIGDYTCLFASPCPTFGSCIVRNKWRLVHCEDIVLKSSLLHHLRVPTRHTFHSWALPSSFFFSSSWSFLLPGLTSLSPVGLSRN